MNDADKVVPFRPRYDPHDEPANEGPDLEQLREGLQTLIRATRRKPLSERECSIRNFRSPRYKLTGTLTVTIEELDGQFTATSLDTGQYGHGFSEEDAIVNLCEVVEEYYEVLLEEEGNLSSVLGGHLRYLRDILETR